MGSSVHSSHYSSKISDAILLSSLVGYIEKVWKFTQSLMKNHNMPLLVPSTNSREREKKKDNNIVVQKVSVCDSSSWFVFVLKKVWPLI